MKAASKGFSALRRAQRGVAAVFAAVSLLTLLAGLGLAIDVGRFYYAKRDLQRLADLAAIDGARMLSQCLGPAGSDQVTAEVTASLARNRLPAGSTTLTAIGSRASGDDGLQVFRPVTDDSQPGVQVGLDTGNSGFDQEDSKGTIDAVQVTLSLQSPSRILPLFQGEPARTLTVRSAASSTSNVSLELSSQTDSSTGTEFKQEYYSGALRTGLGFGGGSISDAAEASVELSRFSFNTADAAAQVPGANDEIPVLGLLTELSNTLDATGDTTGAQLVNAYAAAVAAGRPGNNAIPPEVLGLPARGAYDGATATTGAILDAITGAITQGQIVALGNLCAVLPTLRDLSAVQALPELCDTSLEVSTPQGSRPFTTTSPSQLLSVDSSGSDFARAASGLVRVRLGLTNPLTAAPIRVPLLATVEGARAVGALRGCAAVGQSRNVVDVVARNGRATFAVGDSGRFDQSFGTSDVDVSRVLEDIGPVPVLTATVGDVLRHAGLNLVAGNPLFAGLMGQSMTVSAYAAPITVGDTSERQFCMQTPPENTIVQCNGAPARTGGLGSAEIARDLPEALGAVQLSVQLPSGLPAGLAGELQPAIDQLTGELSGSLQNAITLVATEVLRPTMGRADLTLGASTVKLTSAGARQPKVFAQ